MNHNPNVCDKLHNPQPGSEVAGNVLLKTPPPPKVTGKSNTASDSNPGANYAGMSYAELIERKGVLCGMAGNTEEGRLELLTIQRVLNGGAK